MHLGPSSKTHILQKSEKLFHSSLFGPQENGIIEGGRNQFSNYLRYSIRNGASEWEMKFSRKQKKGEHSDWVNLELGIGY